MMISSSRAQHQQMLLCPADMLQVLNTRLLLPLLQ